jgi:hypothetical protein
MRLFGGAFGVNFAAVLFRYYSNSSLKSFEEVFHRELTLKNLSLLKVLPPSIIRQIQVICLNALNKIYLLGKCGNLCNNCNQSTKHTLFIVVVVIASGIAFIATLFIKKFRVSF